MDMQYTAKLQRLYAKARPEERKEVAAAIAAVVDGFRGMLVCAKEWAQTNRTGKLDVTPLCKAMAALHRIGREYDIEFPDGTDVEEVKVFVLKFGAELVNGGKERAA